MTRSVGAVHCGEASVRAARLEWEDQLGGAARFQNGMVLFTARQGQRDAAELGTFSCVYELPECDHWM